MGVMTHRRYRARMAALRESEAQEATSLTHAAVAEEGTTGTPLPDDFPARDLLLTARPVPYRYYEDLYGADEAELTRVSGIGPSTARKIIAAYDAWAES